MKLPDLLKACVETAQEAGTLIKDLASKPRKIEHKGPFDLVTDADKAANDLIVTRLQESFPDSVILAEESESFPKDFGELLWIVDPIDGTTNYSRGIPHVAVSIAAYAPAERRVLAGCVHNPFSGESFWASYLNGSFLNGTPIHVTKTSVLKDALCATGFFNTGHLKFELSNMPESYRFLEKSLGLRRFGTASLDLCWIACGRFDVYWEKGLKPWDIAAGALILTEAGGQVSNFDGSNLDLWGESILATNQALHPASLALLV